MENSVQQPGRRAYPGIYLICLFLAATMTACDSGGDGGSDSERAALNEAADAGAHVSAANVEIMATIYALASAGKDGQGVPKDTYPFTCSESGGGSADGNFNFDGTSASWTFNVYLSNCNSINGYIYMEGNSVPGSTLTLDNFLSGQQVYDGCTIDFGAFNLSISGVTLTNPPTVGEIRWNGFLQVNCDQSTSFIGCEFQNDLANTTSQIRTAVIEHCGIYSTE